MSEPAEHRFQCHQCDREWVAVVPLTLTAHRGPSPCPVCKDVRMWDEVPLPVREGGGAFRSLEELVAATALEQAKWELKERERREALVTEQARHLRLAAAELERGRRELAAYVAELRAVRAGYATEYGRACEEIANELEARFLGGKA